jgi:two-component system, cell cycle response regulator CtrA
MRVFLHDPDRKRRQGIREVLERSGAEPQLIESSDSVRGLSALAGAAAAQLPLVLGQDPATLGLVMALRKAGAENALLVVTDARDAERDAALLDAGACDVLARPLHPVELAARLRAAQRRRTGLVQSEVQVGDLVVHLDGRDPTLQAKPVNLSSKENALLCLLAAQRGRVLSRNAIFDLLYGLTDYQPFDKAIDIHICRIRAKLAQVAPQARHYIETFPGRGYALRSPAPVPGPQR